MLEYHDANLEMRSSTPLLFVLVLHGFLLDLRGIFIVCSDT